MRSNEPLLVTATQDRENNLANPAFNSTNGMVAIATCTDPSALQALYPGDLCLDFSRVLSTGAPRERINYCITEQAAGVSLSKRLP
jgi:hypothetical protein